MSRKTRNRPTSRNRPAAPRSPSPSTRARRASGSTRSSPSCPACRVPRSGAGSTRRAFEVGGRRVRASRLLALGETIEARPSEPVELSLTAEAIPLVVLFEDADLDRRRQAGGHGRPPGPRPSGRNPRERPAAPLPRRSSPESAGCCDRASSTASTAGPRACSSPRRPTWPTAPCPSNSPCIRSSASTAPSSAACPRRTPAGSTARSGATPTTASACRCAPARAVPPRRIGRSSAAIARRASPPSRSGPRPGGPIRSASTSRAPDCRSWATSSTAVHGATRPLLGRPALHAARLGFLHPRSGVRQTFEAPLPADLLALLASLDLEPATEPVADGGPRR